MNLETVEVREISWRQFIDFSANYLTFFQIIKIIAKIKLRSTYKNKEMNRRKFIAKTLKAGVGFSLISGIYAWQIEPFWLDFVKIKMPVKNLPPELIGKTLMQISDIHVGNRFNYQYIIDALKEAQNHQPDIVVYTGDYVSYENEEQINQLQKVMKFATKGSIGTIGILGNHDYGKNWADQNVADKIKKVLEDN